MLAILCMEDFKFWLLFFICAFGGRYLSRKDIQLIAGSGCPSLDRKVVNSGKRLRAFVGIDEGTVCAPFPLLFCLSSFISEYYSLYFIIIKEL